MSISNNVQRRMAEGVWIRQMFEDGIILKKSFGEENVFDLTLGNPVVEPPVEFENELKKLVCHPLPGMHRYMENAGYAETRSAIATQLSIETGLKFTQNNIIMTCGAAGALNVVLKAILNPEDEVIIFAPYFAEYVNYIDNHGGVTKVVPADEIFIPKLDALENSITPKTKALIINSPNNPSGAVYSKELIKSLGELLSRKEAQYSTNIYLISDEAYRKLIYDGLEYPPVFCYFDRSIVVTSHSKDLALPGERIGYIAVHPDCNHIEELMSGLIFCNRILGFVNAPALMQRAICGFQNVTVSIEDYQQKRDFLYSHLVNMGYSVMKPQGAFYMFPESPIDDEVAFVKELRDLNILTVPGRGFGLPGYFRISFCVTDKTLEGSLPGFEKIAQKYKHVSVFRK